MEFLKLIIKICIIFSVSTGYSASPSEWTLIAEEDNIRVMRGGEEKDGDFPFKVEGEIDASLEQVVNILLDFDRKPEWSPKCDRVTTIEKYSDYKYFVNEKYLSPWPARNREFFLLGEIIVKDEDHVVITARSDDSRGLEDPSSVVADVDHLDIYLTRLSDNKTNMVFIFQGDLKGWIPQWLKSLIQGKWPLLFMQGIREQLKKDDITWCSGYKAIADSFNGTER